MLVHHHGAVTDELATTVTARAQMASLAVRSDGSLVAFHLGDTIGYSVRSPSGDWSEQNAEPVRYEDRALGVYKKLTVRDGKLAGVILVGDVSDSHRYMEWLRSGADLTSQRRHLLFPPPAADAGHDVAEMAESATICGCVGVTKGAIIEAIHGQGVNTLSQLKECTRASTSCGSCTSLCQDLLRAVAPGFEEEQKQVICGCLPFAEDRLRAILRSQRLKSVQAVLEIYGNGVGCEVCKPTIASILASVFNESHFISLLEGDEFRHLLLTGQARMIFPEAGLPIPSGQYAVS